MFTHVCVCNVSFSLIQLILFIDLALVKCIGSCKATHHSKRMFYLNGFICIFLFCFVLHLDLHCCSSSVHKMVNTLIYSILHCTVLHYTISLCICVQECDIGG